MWINNPDGKTPAEIAAAAGMAIHGGNGHYPQRQNQIAQLIASLTPAIKDYIRQKRNDAIANQLMNMQEPPRAEAVDPSLQGAPATRPFTGGAQGLAAHQMYEKMMQEKQDSQPDTAMEDLQYQHLYRQTHPEEFPTTQGNGPQYVDTPQGRMTAHEWAVIQREQNKANSRGVGGLTVQQLDQPGYVRYEDKDGNPRSNEQAQADPEGTFAVPPNAKTRTPYSQWISAADLYRKAQGGGSKAPEPKVIGQPTDSAEPNTNPQDHVPILDEARKAIQKGANPEAVKKRLAEMGIDASGL
jgi:hypothetical protein